MNPKSRRARPPRNASQWRAHETQWRTAEICPGDRASLCFFDTDAAECVVDQTTRIVYGDHAYVAVLIESKSVMLPADSPAGALGPSWSITNTVSGQVVGTVLGTADSGKSNVARTRLYVRAVEGQSYR